jgi:exodeoxyribonuclease VII small subunit
MTKEKISYNEAVAEIESILENIEAGNLDVDALTEKVSRVTQLLKICRDKLHKTETQIDQILGKGEV